MTARDELAAVLADWHVGGDEGCEISADEALDLADALLASPALARVIREATAGEAGT